MRMINMYSITKIKSLIALLLLIGLSAPLSAHMLNETTAQVILRDGQIEVRIITNMEHLTENLQNDQAWLMGDINKVMPKNLDEQAQLDFIKTSFQQLMNIQVNQQLINFEAATVEDKTINNKKVTEIVLQASHSFTKVNSINITFPSILGTVHVSFVKPQYRLLKPGESTNIVFE